MNVVRTHAKIYTYKVGHYIMFYELFTTQLKRRHRHTIVHSLEGQLLVLCHKTFATAYGL